MLFHCGQHPVEVEGAESLPDWMKKYDWGLSATYGKKINFRSQKLLYNSKRLQFGFSYVLSVLVEGKFPPKGVVVLSPSSGPTTVEAVTSIESKGKFSSCFLVREGCGLEEFKNQELFPNLEKLLELAYSTDIAKDKVLEAVSDTMSRAVKASRGSKFALIELANNYTRLSVALGELSGAIKGSQESVSSLSEVIESLTELQKAQLELTIKAINDSKEAGE